MRGLVKAGINDHPGDFPGRDSLRMGWRQPVHKARIQGRASVQTAGARV